MFPSSSIFLFMVLFCGPVMSGWRGRWVERNCIPPSDPRFGVHNHTKPVIYIHMHKASGTNICCLANRNREVVFPDSGNCDKKGEGPFSIINFRPKEDAPSQWSCERRQAEFLEHGVTWTAVESWLHSPLCFEYFDYAMLLREPISRILSSNRMNHVPKEVMLRWMRGISNIKDKERWGSPLIASPAIVNNFYVRTLLGKEVFFKRVGSLTEAHLAKAMDLVRQFKVVGIMEDYDTSMRLFREEFGWNNMRQMDHKTDKKPKKYIDLNPEERAKLETLNALDIRLYNWVKDELMPAKFREYDAKYASYQASLSPYPGQTTQEVIATAAARSRFRDQSDHRQIDQEEEEEGEDGEIFGENVQETEKDWGIQIDIPNNVVQAP